MPSNVAPGQSQTMPPPYHSATQPQHVSRSSYGRGPLPATHTVQRQSRFVPPSQLQDEYHQHQPQHPLSMVMVMPSPNQHLPPPPTTSSPSSQTPPTAAPSPPLAAFGTAPLPMATYASVSVFGPPPPPNVNFSAELSRPDSDTPAGKVAEILFTMARRWVHKLELWLSTYPFERPNTPCPAPEQYSTIELWLEKLCTWYEANFRGRKAFDAEAHRLAMGADSSRPSRAGKQVPRLYRSEGDAPPPPRLATAAHINNQERDYE